MVPLGYSDDMSWNREDQDMWENAHKFIVVPNHGDDAFFRMMANALARSLLSEIRHSGGTLEMNGTHRGVFHPVRHALHRAMKTLAASDLFRVGNDFPTQ